MSTIDGISAFASPAEVTPPKFPAAHYADAAKYVSAYLALTRPNPQANDERLCVRRQVRDEGRTSAEHRAPRL
jgi:hypothetical protein